MLLTSKEKEPKIDWLFPDNNQENANISVEDFRQMAYEAEKEEGMSLSSYKAKMDVWWQKHI